MHPESIQPGGGRLSSVSSFVIVQGLAAAGVIAGMLAATSITAATDGGKYGALWTGAFLLLLFVPKAAAIRFVPGWSARFGARRSFGATLMGAIVLWSVAGIVVIAGGPGTLVLCAIAPFVGIMNAAFVIEAPLLARTFLSKHSMAGANARVSVARGIACALGSLGAGLLINVAGAGWALICRALLSFPLLLLIRDCTSSPVLAASAQVESPTPEETVRPAGAASPALRRPVLLAIMLTVTTAPLIAMIVPIAQSLRQAPLVTGASIMMAAISAGALLAPFFVSRFERRQHRGGDPISAALVVTGLAVLALGIVSLVVTRRAELVAWVVVGLVFGGSESASHSTLLGEVVASTKGGDPRQAIAKLKFSMNAAAPAGFVVWAILLDATSGAVAVLTAAGVLLVSTAVLGRRRSARAHEHGLGHP